MKKRPLILVLWALCSLMFQSIDAYSTDEKTNIISNENFSCTLDMTATPNGVYCGQSTGSIDIKITGAIGSVKIEWDNTDMSIWEEITTNESSYTITDLPSGWYLIKIKDEKGCSVEKKVYVDVNASNLTYTIEPSDPCISNGSFIIRIAGSTPPYWVILDGPTSGGVIATSNAFRIDNLRAGNYSITIDKDGCGHSQNANLITTPITLSASAELIDNNVCDAFGDVQLNITGGTLPFSIFWHGQTSGSTTSNGSKTIQNLEPGSYTFTIRDANLCTTTTTATVTASGTDLYCVLTQTPVICDNMGQIGISISGGLPTYRVDYSGPKTGAVIATTTGDRAATASILDLPAGDYTIKVTDSRGCVASESITVGGTITDLACIVTQTPQICDNMGTIGVTISGGQPTYRVDYTGPTSGAIIATTTGDRTASANISGLANGYYTIVVTDSRGCTATENISVGGGPSYLVCEVSVQSHICESNAGVNVAISGGTPTYLISYSGTASGSVASNGGSTFIPLPIGQYTIQVTDANGCTATETATVGEGVNDLHCRLVQTHAICHKPGSIEVIISGGKPGFTVKWSTGHGENTAYSPGYNYIFEVPCPGVYDITVIDANGCVVMESTEVRQLENNLAYQLFANSGGQEGNGSIEIYFQQGKSPYTIDLTGPSNQTVISNGATVLSSLPSGLYSVFVVDANGCDKQIYIEVPKVDNLGPNLGRMRISVAEEQLLSEEKVIEKKEEKEKFELNINFLENKEASDEFQVFQNYPNPFTGSTIIGFNLPQKMEVTIAIHNAQGKKVAITQKEFAKGLNQFEFNRTDLGTGVFYYTISAGEFSKTTRMLHIE